MMRIIRELLHQQENQHGFWFLGLLFNVGVIIDTVIIVVIIVVTLWAVQFIHEASIKGSAQVFWIDLRSHRRLQAILLTLIILFFRSSLITFEKNLHVSGEQLKDPSVGT